MNKPAGYGERCGEFYTVYFTAVSLKVSVTVKSKCRHTGKGETGKLIQWSHLKFTFILRCLNVITLTLDTQTSNNKQLRLCCAVNVKFEQTSAFSCKIDHINSTIHAVFDKVSWHVERRMLPRVCLSVMRDRNPQIRTVDKTCLVTGL